MNQTLTEPKVRICFKCHFEANTTETKCPRCGRPLQTQIKVRTLGVLIIICGVFISSMMTVILAALYPVLSQPNDSSKFLGTANQAHLILIILGLTFAAGVSFATAGLWQIIFGRRSRILVWTSVSIILIGGIVTVLFIGIN